MVQIFIEFPLYLVVWHATSWRCIVRRLTASRPARSPKTARPVEARVRSNGSLGYEPRSRERIDIKAALSSGAAKYVDRYPAG